MGTNSFVKPGKYPAPPTTQPLSREGHSFMGGEGCYTLWDVTCVNVHPTVRAIEERGFYQHSELNIVSLEEGLEEIGEGAFAYCTSLCKILSPYAVKAIKDETFYHC
jgi:hypothetical protein